MDFETIARAGLTQKQFALMVGVDRVTVNTWVRGRRKPLAPARVTAALRVLQRAIDRGDLPITRTDAPLDEFIRAVAVRLAQAPAAPKG